MIDFRNERVIPLRDAHKFIPCRTPGKRIAQATIWRWATRRNNPLETFRTPGGRFTSVEAIDRFIDRCTRGDDGASAGEDGRPGPRAVAAGRQLAKLLGGRVGEPRATRHGEEGTGGARS